MQLAEILSDLTSLRACNHKDALALVTVNERIASRKSAALPSAADGDPETKTQRSDLQRAKELVDLHHEIKVKHAGGSVGEELARARDEVKSVLEELDISK